MEARKGSMQKQQSALMVMLNVVVQWSDHVILIVSRIVNQQFPAPFVSFFFFFLEASSWNVVAYIMTGHHVVNFFHLMGVSVSRRQLPAYSSEDS